jgi:hypothetical protein
LTGLNLFGVCGFGFEGNFMVTAYEALFVPIIIYTSREVKHRL